MEICHVYMRFADGKDYQIPDLSLDFAVDVVYANFQNQILQRHHVISCWIVNASTSQRIRGAPPADWSPDYPYYEIGRASCRERV